MDVKASFNNKKVTELPAASLLIDKYKNTPHLGNDVYIINGINLIFLTERVACPSRLNGFFIGLCTKGKASITVNIDEFTIEKNVFISIPNDTIIQVNSSEDIEVTGVMISKDFLQSINLDFKKILPFFLKMGEKYKRFRVLSDEDIANFKPFFNLLNQTVTSGGGDYHTEVVRAIITSFIYKLFDSFSLNNREENDTKQARSRQYIIFENFMELLKEYHTKERSVGFYANQMCLTPKYLSKIISDVSGKSAAKWIDHFVVLEAKNLLKHSGMSVQEVAYSLNFSNQSFFGKYFKNQTGMSPGEYKEN